MTAGWIVADLFIITGVGLAALSGSIGLEPTGTGGLDLVTAFLFQPWEPGAAACFFLAAVLRCLSDQWMIRFQSRGLWRSEPYQTHLALSTVHGLGLVAIGLAFLYPVGSSFATSCLIIGLLLAVAGGWRGVNMLEHLQNVHQKLRPRNAKPARTFQPRRQATPRREAAFRLTYADATTDRDRHGVKTIDPVFETRRNASIKFWVEVVGACVAIFVAPVASNPRGAGGGGNMYFPNPVDILQACGVFLLLILAGATLFACWTAAFLKQVQVLVEGLAAAKRLRTRHNAD